MGFSGEMEYYLLFALFQLNIICYFALQGKRNKVLLCVGISFAVIMLEYLQLNIFQEHLGLREGMLYSGVANNLGFVYLTFKYLPSSSTNDLGKIPSVLRALVNQFMTLSAASAIICLLLVVFGVSYLADGRDGFERNLLIALLITNAGVGFLIWWGYSRLRYSEDNIE